MPAIKEDFFIILSDKATGDRPGEWECGDFVLCFGEGELQRFLKSEYPDGLGTAEVYKLGYEAGITEVISYEIDRKQHE